MHADQLLVNIIVGYLTFLIALKRQKWNIY